MEQNYNFSAIELSRIDIPIAKEGIKTRSEYIQFGITSNDDFFDVIIDAYNNSTTNSACIEGISDLIFGKGLYSENPELNSILENIFPQEDVKRSVFDIKLFGSSALQIYWNDEHTKIIKIYHIPVQNIRAGKIYETPKVETYYYATDWKDQKCIKNKRPFAAFGTSSDKVEILYIKSYQPGKFYYSLPDWYSSLELAYVEGELNNLHYNNVSNGFFPSLAVQLNNGIPGNEERQSIETSLNNKFGGSKNAGRIMVMFNNGKETSAEITPINIDNLHDKFKYVAEYATDKILVSHRVTSPLLFGIRTTANGFSSNADELNTAYSILQSMTINPFQNLFLTSIDTVLRKGGYPNSQLYFDQLTPSAILAIQAEQTNTTVDQVEKNIQDASNIE